MGFKPVMEKSQADLLLDHFRVRSSISPMEAQGMYLIRSLSRRINDLEKLGYVFFREQNTDARGQRYVRYHMVAGKKQKAA